MAYILIGDAHIDHTNGSDWYLKQLSERIDFLFKLSEDRDIGNFIFMGDFFDKRTGVNTKALEFIKKKFLYECYERSYVLIFILGNHDIYHKNTIRPNSLETFIHRTSNTFFITKIQSFGGMTFVPWICEENQEEIMKYIENDTNEICLGHFEFVGFPMMKNGQPMNHGLSTSAFSKYKKVISGHYHTHSEYGNVMYTGSFNQMTKADLNDPKYLFILHDDKSIEKIEMPIEYFVSLNLSKSTPLEIKSSLDYKKVYLTIEKGCSVQEINEAKSLIEKYSYQSLHIEDNNMIELDIEEVDEDFTQTSDTISLIYDIIERTELNEVLDKTILKDKIGKIFMEIK